jgi:hypothetical protein
MDGEISTACSRCLSTLAHPPTMTVGASRRIGDVGVDHGIFAFGDTFASDLDEADVGDP